MMMPGGMPVLVLQQGAQRDQGRRTQLANIAAGRTVSDVVRTTLGPKSMLKMMLDPLGGIVITNDGNAILREIDVTHPAAKSIIELSRAQDEEVGDGTTSVVILTGEILNQSEEILNNKIHPTLMVRGYFNALNMSLDVLNKISITLDLNDQQHVLDVIASSMNTKFSSTWSKIITKLALDAVKIVAGDTPNDEKRADESGPTWTPKRDVDIKRYARIEKIPGGQPSDCQVYAGIVIEKDVTHPKMRRLIKNPRIVLLDSPLEYKKGESMTNVEITKEDEFEKLLLQEEAEVKKMCDLIAAVGCDLVITEKGVSDLAAHFLIKKNISVIRRAKKTDQNRLARATGATIVNRCEELTEQCVGTRCKLFKVDKIDDDYWTFLTECEDPKACTIMLRGGSKDSLNEIERNLHDALNVARNIYVEGKLLPGGGAVEQELSCRLKEAAENITSLDQWGFKAVAQALEIIPRTLAQNCGADVIRTVAALRAAHATPEGVNMGLNGLTGEIVDVVKAGIWDMYSVKAQMLKTACECAAMLMRVDDVLSGIGKKPEMRPEITNYGGAEEAP